MLRFSGSFGVDDDNEVCCSRYVMEHGVGPYLGLNDIGSPSPIMTFITIKYLSNFIFGFIR